MLDHEEAVGVQWTDGADASEEPSFVVSESLAQYMPMFYSCQVCFMRGLSNDADMRHFIRIVRPIGSKATNSNRLVARHR